MTAPRPTPPATSGPLRAIAATAVAVIVFAVAMGYVESAVVVDLQAALGLPSHPTFPLEFATGPAVRLAWIEVGREFATLVMLIGVGWLAGRGGWAWLAWVAVAWGAWDLAYYGWLVVFEGWPRSLFDWDLLFLLPVPWTGPVWAPSAISVALIGTGLATAARCRSGLPLVVRRRHVLAGVVGGLLVILSFTLDAPQIVAGGIPSTYPWPLFAAGLGVALVAAWDVLRPRHPRGELTMAAPGRVG